MLSAEWCDNLKYTRHLNIFLQVSKPIAFQYSISECEPYFAARAGSVSRKMYEPRCNYWSERLTGLLWTIPKIDLAFFAAASHCAVTKIPLLIAFQIYNFQLWSTLTWGYVLCASLYISQYSAPVQLTNWTDFHLLVLSFVFLLESVDPSISAVYITDRLLWVSSAAFDVRPCQMPSYSRGK